MPTRGSFAYQPDEHLDSLPFLSLSLSSSLLLSFSLSKHGAAAPLEVRVVTLEFVAINQGGNYASGKYE